MTDITIPTIHLNGSSKQTLMDDLLSAHKAIFIEANERYTTQTCSCCGCISDSSPKGRAGLRIRQWNCPECGASHDRDVNAARNILRVGLEHQALVGEISGV